MGTNRKIFRDWNSLCIDKGPSHSCTPRGLNPCTIRRVDMEVGRRGRWRSLGRSWLFGWAWNNNFPFLVLSIAFVMVSSAETHLSSKRSVLRTIQSHQKIQEIIGMPARPEQGILKQEPLYERRVVIEDHLWGSVS